MLRIFDLAMTHSLDADDFFIHRVQQHCAERGLNFFLIEPLWVFPFLDHLQAESLRVRVLLNMHSEHHEPEDLFHRLVRQAALRGTHIIDPPDIALEAFNKAALHHRLQQAGIDVPYTLMVHRHEMATVRFTPQQTHALGKPFVIKPSLGYGKKGVILDATGPEDLQRSAALWTDERYLVQEKIVPRRILKSPAYFRVFYVFGTTWCCWWDCYTDGYRLLTAEEMDEFQLRPLEHLARHIAQVSQMQFFSTEIAQTDSGRFVVIDYVNDQCHMLTQSANPAIGVPDELVAAIARRLVEAAEQKMKQCFL